MLQAGNFKKAPYLSLSCAGSTRVRNTKRCFDQTGITVIRSPSIANVENMPDFASKWCIQQDRTNDNKQRSTHSAYLYACCPVKSIYRLGCLPVFGKSTAVECRMASSVQSL
eukprot:1162021-Pelagomonas_calceolata.AAC.13